jgi:hypothetical protein
VSVNKDTDVPLSASGASPSADPPLSRRHVLPLITYGLGTGIVTTAAGLWASSGLSGTLQMIVWVGVTAVLAVGAVCLSGSAVSLLARCYRLR